MKLVLSLLTLFLASATAEDLVTVSGKTYKNVTVKKVEPDGLSISHEGGAAKVKFEDLSEDLQKKHGYDPFKAYDHEQQAKQAQAAREAADAARRKKENQEHSRSEKWAATLAQTKRLSIAGRLHSPDDFERILGGSAYEGGDPDPAKVRELGYGKRLKILKGQWKSAPVMKGKIKTGEREQWVFDKLPTEVYLDGGSINRPTGGDGVVWDQSAGELWRIGSAQFRDATGSTRTLPRYTDSLNDAAAFYWTHGFPPASDSVTFEGKKLVTAGDR